MKGELEIGAGLLLKNRFVLEELIGSGRLCDVYKALDLRRQEAQAPQPYVAIKTLKDEYRDKINAHAFVALAFESFRTSAINHPNVAAIFDFDKMGDIAFLTMELMEGQTLATSLEENSVDNALELAEGICRGLQCVHHHGVLHLNIRPDTIFVTAEGIAKLIGFGNTREIGSASDMDTMIKALGPSTHAYASPEMLADEEPSPADDVFSLGVVIYQLFSGSHPYGGALASEALDKGIEPARAPGLDDQQWEALASAFRLRRGDRLQTVPELALGMGF